MNKKAGLYIGAIALAAIAVIAAISFNSISSARAQETGGQTKAILDLKWEAQNAQFVAGKAVADALADASYTATTCGYDAAQASGKIEAYLTTVKQQAFPGCSFSVLSANGAGNPADITVSLQLACEKDSGENLKTSCVKTVEFKKQVQTSITAGNQCTVIVNNIDATPYEEVHQTATFSP